MLKLSFCGIFICHIMGDMIRVDATPGIRPLGHFRRSSRSNDFFINVHV